MMTMREKIASMLMMTVNKSYRNPIYTIKKCHLIVSPSKTRSISKEKKIFKKTTTRTNDEHQ